MYGNFYQYNKKLKSYSQNLRKTGTLSEVILWNAIKGKQLNGFRFLRQRPIGSYIVDFYCKELKLAIEIQGETHDYKLDYDNRRQRYLESLGIKVLNFSEMDVRMNLNEVLEKIISHINPTSSVT